VATRFTRSTIELDLFGALFLTTGRFFAALRLAAPLFAEFDRLVAPAFRVAAPFFAALERFFAPTFRVAAPFFAALERFFAPTFRVAAPFFAALERLAAFFPVAFFAAPRFFAGDFFAALRVVPRPFFFAAIAASPLPDSGRRYCANHVDVAGKFRAQTRVRRTCYRMLRLHSLLHHTAFAQSAVE